MIFGRKRNDDIDDDDEDEEELELVLFQGAVNGVEANLAENAKLVQVGLVRAKELVSDGMGRRAEMIRIDQKGNAAISTFFIDGVPYPAGKMPAQAGNAITQMLKLLAGLDVRERTKPQSGGINAEFEEKKYKLLVDTFPEKTGGERLIVRVIDPKEKLERPEEIGLSEGIRRMVRDYSSEKNGVIIAAGPPMSGTSTTALGLMRCVDAYMYGIFDIARTVKRELSHVTDFKWLEGDDLDATLMRIKRQDADVAVIDPIVSSEIAKPAFDKASTLSIISEMAARDAADAIVRLVAFVGNPKLVADQLKLVVSQKLIRMLCTKCKQAFRPNPKLLQKVNLPPETKVLYRVPRPIELEDGEIEEPEFCEHCNGIGYRGRIALMEEIHMTPGIAELILAGKDAAAIRQQARKEGMQSFQNDALRIVAEGKTTLEELQRAFRQPAS
ncbi:MAG: ATPase, T2SS/T4P/T4SS family [Planctomycetaceae bacterium]